MKSYVLDCSCNYYLFIKFPRGIIVHEQSVHVKIVYEAYNVRFYQRAFFMLISIVLLNDAFFILQEVCQMTGKINFKGGSTHVKS